MKKTEDVLLEFGITPNLKGFDYICKAVEHISADRTVKMCKVYEMVAEDFDSTYIRVERAIRNALEKADRKCDAYQKYVGIKSTKNSEILYTLALKLREE